MVLEAYNHLQVASQDKYNDIPYSVHGIVL